MFENIRADLNRKRRGFGVRPEDQTFFRQWITPFLEFGTFGVLVYRFGYWAYSIKIPVIRQLLIAVYLFVDVFCMAVTGIKIQRESNIGPGLVIHNFSNIQVLVKRMGHSCTLNQDVSAGIIPHTGHTPAAHSVYFAALRKIMRASTGGNNVVVSASSMVL